MNWKEETRECVKDIFDDIKLLKMECNILLNDIKENWED